MYNPHTRELYETLMRLREYASAVEGFLEREAEALGSRLEEEAKRFPEDERGEYFEVHALDIVEISHEMPTLLRHSVVTAADAALERYLMDTCRTHATLNQKPWPPSPPWRSPLGGARKYLKSVAGIAFPDQDRSWTAVLRLRELRNAIVHADADVSSLAALRQWLQEQEHVTVSVDYTVSFETHFLDDALSWYRQFAEALDSACEQLGLWASVFPPEEDVPGASS